jgi:hypothetical protein
MRQKSILLGIGICFLSSSFLVCGCQYIFKNRVIEAYVSADYPRGDLSLSLYRDRTFVLEFKQREDESGQYTENRKLLGMWKKEREGALILTTLKGIQIRYRYKPDIEVITRDRMMKLKGYIWKSSSVPTFADGIYLIEKEKLNKYFLHPNNG